MNDIKKPTFEELKKRQNDAKIITAYTNYKSDPDDHQIKFFEELTKFVTTKIRSKVWDSPAAGPQIDDAAQEIVISIWQSLDKFRGGPETFPAWTATIARRAGCRLFNKTLEITDSFTPFFEAVENEDGKMEIVENLEVRADGARKYKRNGKTVHCEPGPRRSVQLPDWIQGTDLDICTLIESGLEYASIAERLGLTLFAVKKRISRMKTRTLAEKEAAKSLRQKHL